MTTLRGTPHATRAVPLLRATGIAGAGVSSFDDVREQEPYAGQWDGLPHRDPLRRGKLKTELAKAQEEVRKLTQVKRDPDPDPGDGDDDCPEEDDDWADALDGASLGSRSSRRRRSKKEEIRWSGGAPPEVPSFSSTLGRYKDFDIWIRKLEVYKKLAKPYLPPEEQALRLYNSISGDPGDELEPHDPNTFYVPDGIDKIVEVLVKAGWREDRMVGRVRALSEFETINRSMGEGLGKYLTRFMRVIETAKMGARPSKTSSRRAAKATTSTG